jgi:hypothetical protein
MIMRMKRYYPKSITNVCFSHSCIGTQVQNNFNGIVKFPEIVEEKLAKEISQGRIAGPFHELPFVNVHISSIGLVPKKEVGQYRLIHNLSYPTDKSINEHIPDELKTVHY